MKQPEFPISFESSIYSYYSDFVKSNDAEFIQYLNPVGSGPSGKIWPR